MFVLFFFSSRRRHTRSKRDWSSDVCSSDLEEYSALLAVMRRLVPEKNEVPALIDDISTKAKVRGVTIGRIEPQPVEAGPPFDTRSEERRVGKEGRGGEVAYRREKKGEEYSR